VQVVDVVEELGMVLGLLMVEMVVAEEELMPFILALLEQEVRDIMEAKVLIVTMAQEVEEEWVLLEQMEALIMEEMEVTE